MWVSTPIESVKMVGGQYEVALDGRTFRHPIVLLAGGFEGSCKMVSTFLKA